MHINEYIAQLQEIAKKYPKAEMVYSVDEEGNGFDAVFNLPTPGHFDASTGGFQPRPHARKKVNAVCVN
jgi:hypothetical protein